MLDEVRKVVKNKNTPVEVINQKLYGSMNGEAVLKMALEMLNK